MNVQETPFFFPSGDRRLYGVLHQPAGRQKQQGVVVCPPFGEEYLWSQRALVNFARVMAASGYSVLRFEYMGTGDSEGDFEEVSVQSMISDILAASKMLKDSVERVTSIALVGLRFGATLAVMAADKDESIRTVTLWDPIMDGASYLRSLLRTNIATQSAVYREIRQDSEALIQSMRVGKTVNIEGYEMSWPMFSQAFEIDLTKLLEPDVEHALLVQIVRKEGEIDQSYAVLRNQWGCEVAQAVELPFWKEIRTYRPRADNLTRITREWLERKDF